MNGVTARTLAAQATGETSDAGPGVRIPRALGRRFRRHLGTDSSVTWARIPEHLGTDSGAPGRSFRSTWAPIPEGSGALDRLGRVDGRNASAAVVEGATTRGCRSDTRCAKFVRFCGYDSRWVARNEPSKPRPGSQRARSATT